MNIGFYDSYPVVVVFSFTFFLSACTRPSNHILFIFFTSFIPPSNSKRYTFSQIFHFILVFTQRNFGTQLLSLRLRSITNTRQDDGRYDDEDYIIHNNNNMCNAVRNTYYIFKFPYHKRYIAYTRKRTNSVIANKTQIIIIIAINKNVNDVTWIS